MVMQVGSTGQTISQTPQPTQGSWTTGRLALAAVRGKDRLDRDGALERTFADAEIALGDIVGMSR